MYFLLLFRRAPRWLPHAVSERPEAQRRLQNPAPGFTAIPGLLRNDSRYDAFALLRKHFHQEMIYCNKNESKQKLNPNFHPLYQQKAGGQWFRGVRTGL